MEGATALLSNPPHFPITPKDFLPQPYPLTPSPSMRKRKPIVTYQSPCSGVVDVGLLVRNTALEFKVAAATAAARSLVPTATKPPAIAAEPAASDVTISNSKDSTSQLRQHATRIIPVAYRPAAIPRPPRPLYHPFSRPSASKPAMKSSTSIASITSHLAVPSIESGRRSSSRTRRPAPKVRDTEGLVSLAKVAQDRVSPVKRRRGAATGKRRRGAAQHEADGDGAYPATKRSRKPKEKTEVEIEGDAMPPPSTKDTSPQMGYSTRAKRPRKVAHVRAESSTSDGTGSVTRTTPVNGHVEEFWVPTKGT